MPVDDLTDEELMVKYQNGNEKAFHILYERHSGKVYGYLKKRMKQKESVADIFQDVFIKIHKSKHLYNKSMPVLPWIFTITKTTLIDSIRKNKNSSLADSADFENMAAPIPESNSDLQTDTAQLINKLSSTHQAAVHLRYVDEKTFEEIAETLKVSPTNVRKIISRGIQRLKQLISEEQKS